MKKGDCVINTTSVTAYRGSLHLLDYSSTKGAIVSFTRSASNMLAEKGIRVNGVAPGPIWTPLIPATFSGKDLTEFGQDTPMKRAGQPSEVAPAYVFFGQRRCNLYHRTNYPHKWWRNCGRIIKIYRKINDSRFLNS